MNEETMVENGVNGESAAPETDVINGVTGEVADPNGVNGESADTAPNFDEMSDEEFDDYINNAKVTDQTQNTPENQPENPPAQENQEENPTDSENFMSFHDEAEYQEHINNVISKRINEVRSAERSNIEPLLDLAKAFYNTDDEKTVFEHILSDMKGQIEQNRGMNPDALMQQQKDQRELNEYRFQKQQELQVSQSIENIRNTWNQQAESLKKISPEFSMAKAFENKDFYNKVVNEGYSLSEAYLLMNMQKPQPKPQRKNIAEVAAATTGIGGNIKSDVKTMSDSEFDSYIKKIQQN